MVAADLDIIDDDVGSRRSVGARLFRSQRPADPKRECDAAHILDRQKFIAS
jgi:hypothetical protein